MDNQVESDRKNDVEQYLRTSEVAKMLHVSAKTVARWAKQDKLPHVRTLGGHRRFPAGPVRDLAQRLSGSKDLTNFGL